MNYLLSVNIFDLVFVLFNMSLNDSVYYHPITLCRLWPI